MPRGLGDVERDLETSLMVYRGAGCGKNGIGFINDPLPLPENESSNLDHFNDPSSPRPPPKPPDIEIYLNFNPDAGILTTKMVKDISKHYVLMPNILPTHPTLDLNSDFTPSHDSLRSGNKIFDPGIFIEVQSERLLSRDEFSISFIRDPLSPLFDTLLSFSSENEDKVFNPGKYMRMTIGESIALEIQFDLMVELLPRVNLGVHTKQVEIRFPLSQSRLHAFHICALKFQDDNVLPRNAIICFHVCLDAQRVFA
ncbi:hypothetical protein Tco_1561023 [Tanacetum coccineum]